MTQKMEGHGTIRLVINSCLNDIFLMGLAARSFCDFTPLPQSTSYQIELCIIEAVTNAVKHAYRGESNHEVEMIVTLDSGQITFQICDSGIAMKPLETAVMDFDPDDCQTIPESGMGLFIIQSVMDDVCYTTVNNKNILTMCKRY